MFNPRNKTLSVHRFSRPKNLRLVIAHTRQAVGLPLVIREFRLFALCMSIMIRHIYSLKSSDLLWDVSNDHRPKYPGLPPKKDAARYKLQFDIVDSMG
jgi:hypothetical protein